MPTSLAADLTKPFIACLLAVYPAMLALPLFPSIEEIAIILPVLRGTMCQSALRVPLKT